MKRIGIIGGLGPESTLEYYRMIIDAFKTEDGGFHYPEVIIYSVDLGAAMEMFAQENWDDLAEMLIDKTRALHAAGAEFAAIASNTPHLVFDQVAAASPLPMLSIIEAVLAHVLAKGFTKPGLLGTKLTMSSDLFQRVFEPAGISLVVPDIDDQELTQERLFSEIELGVFTDSTRNELLAVIDKMIAAHGIDSVILGCTELPLILDMEQHGVPLLDTTAIHVAAIAQYCR